MSDLLAEEASAETVLDEVVDASREEDEKRGIAIGKQDTLIRLLQARFTDLPDPILETIRQNRDVELLDVWFDQALAAQGLDEIVFDK